MTPEDALEIANEDLFAYTGRYLTDIQRLILLESLSGKRYEEMKGYQTQHIKNEGAVLWKLLSEALGEKISKSNFQAALERRFRATKRNDTQVLQTSADKQDSARTKSIKSFFLAGCGVGNRVALLPFSLDQENKVTGLDEFITALQLIGLQDQPRIAPILTARNFFTLSDLTQVDKDIVRDIIERFFTAISEVSDEVQIRSTLTEFQWFKFGQLLYEVATFTFLADSAITYIIALELLVEQMGLPARLQKEVMKFIELAKIGEDKNLIYENANQIALSIYTLL